MKKNVVEANLSSSSQIAVTSTHANVEDINLHYSSQ
jgi:hypothetical protein